MTQKAKAWPRGEGKDPTCPNRIQRTPSLDRTWRPRPRGDSVASSVLFEPPGVKLGSYALPLSPPLTPPPNTQVTRLYIGHHASSSSSACSRSNVAGSSASRFALQFSLRSWVSLPIESGSRVIRLFETSSSESRLSRPMSVGSVANAFCSSRSCRSSGRKQSSS